MGLIGHNKRFLWAGVGAAGSMHDSTLLQSCPIFHAFEEGEVLPSKSLHLPEHGEIPFVTVGDSAFPSRVWLMKAFLHHQLFMSPICFCLFLLKFQEHFITFSVCFQNPVQPFILSVVYTLRICFHGFTQLKYCHCLGLRFRLGCSPILGFLDTFFSFFISSLLLSSSLAFLLSPP